MVVRLLITEEKLRVLWAGRHTAMVLVIKRPFAVMEKRTVLGKVT